MIQKDKLHYVPTYYDRTERHGFGYSFPLFSSLLKIEERRKGERIAKIVIKSHASLLDRGVLKNNESLYLWGQVVQGQRAIYVYHHICSLSS